MLSGWAQHPSPVLAGSGLWPAMPDTSPAKPHPKGKRAQLRAQCRALCRDTPPGA